MSFLAHIDAVKIAGAVCACLAVLTLLRFTVPKKWRKLFPTTVNRLGYWWCLVVFVFGQMGAALGRSRADVAHNVLQGVQVVRAHNENRSKAL